MEGMEVPASDAVTYFRWQHGLKYGKPVKKAFLPWPGREGFRRESLYDSRRLFYCTVGPITVRMLDLETGESRSWTLHDRTEDQLAETLADDEIARLLVSDSHIVLITERTRPLLSFRSLVSNPAAGIYLTAWDLKTSKKFSGKIRGYPKQMTLVKDTIVMIGQTVGSPILLWDLNCGRIRSVGSFSPQELLVWHVDTDKNMLVVIEKLDLDTSPPRAQRSKWTLDGELLERTFISASLSGRPADVKEFLEFHFSACQTYGHRTVRGLLHEDHRHTMHLIYDYAVDHLSIRSNYQGAVQNIYQSNSAFLTPDIFYHWCDEKKVIEIFSPDQQTKPVVRYQPHAREVTVREWYKRAKSDGWLDPGDLPLEPLGDREVFCLLSCDGIHFWFFNPNFTPDFPGAEPWIAAEDVK